MKVLRNRIGIFGLIIILQSIISFVGNPASAAVEMKFSDQVGVRSSLTPMEGLDITLNAHYFRTASEYEDYAGLVTQDIEKEQAGCI